MVMLKTMKKTNKTARKREAMRNLKIPYSLHQDIATLGKQHDRTVGKQAVCMLRDAVIRWVAR